MPSVSGNVGAVASVSSVFGRNGGVVAANGDYSGVVAAHLTGATAATRYVGGTASGAPVAGTFAVGDFVIEQTGKVYVCTVAGTPGTWVAPGGSSSVLTATKHIDSAHILTLNSMPVVIVPGVASFVLIPVSVAIVYRFGTIDYTSTNGYGVNWEGFPGNVNDPLADALDDLPVCSNPGIDALYAASASPIVVGGLDLPGFVGAGLVLYVFNADPTGGDGTLDVTTTYLKVAA